MRSPIAKFLSEEEIEAFRGAARLDGAVRRRRAGRGRARALGACATTSGGELGLIDESRDEFLWVTDFPLFEWDEDGKRWTFSHHPFTGVRARGRGAARVRPGSAISQCLRPRLERLGARLAARSGSTSPSCRSGSSGLLGHRRRGRAGALRLPARGAAHGRAAARRVRARASSGFVALLAGEPNIREVVAFPKAASGSEPMTGAPTPIAQEVLAELGIQVLPQKD